MSTPAESKVTKLGSELKTLAIDIGGSGLKASVLDGAGQMITERVRIKTPSECEPTRMVQLLSDLVKPLPSYDRVSVGFPGVVRMGKILTAHNLGQEIWHGFDLDLALEESLGKPVRILNDADVQGLGAVSGSGVEVVITLGTGFGSCFVENGRLSAHLEMAHHPFRKGDTYEEQLGNAAREKVGKKTWNKRVEKAIEILRDLSLFDRLYIGGGNAKAIKFDLPSDVELVSNKLGMSGGIWLWVERGVGSTDLFRRD